MVDNWRIFDRNYQEVSLIFQPMKDLDVILKVWGPDKEQREALGGIMLECSRRAFNFLSSAKALIDHTRVIMTKFYKNTEIYSEYDSYLSQNVKTDSTCKFILDLRNFSSHYQILPILSNVSDFLPNGSLTHTFYLDRSALEENISGAKYLQEYDGNINLEKLFNSYHNKIYLLHSWLISKLQSYHKTDIDDFIPIQEEFFKFMKGLFEA